MIDYYKILGVPRTATELQIKKAYRKLALELHPDKNTSPNAHDQFIKLTEAFEVLKSPKTRNHYDAIFQNSSSSYTSRQQEWKSDVEQKASKARGKGEKYAKDFDYFTEKVIKQTTLMLLLEIVLSLVFADITHGILPPLIFLIGGPLLAYHNLEVMGTTGAIVFGGISAIIGFFWARYQIKRMNLEMDE